MEFRFLRLPSSNEVSSAAPELSPGISHLTFTATYAPFTPNKSDQCLHPPYYRSCWHGVSRCFFTGYPQINRVLTYLSCSPAKELYNPRAFFIHATSLRQAFAHCERFSTAASRRSLGSVSVPVLAVNLSIRLDVLALVSLYHTNKLISHRLLLNHEAFFKVLRFDKYKMPCTTTSGISGRFQPLSRS